ncbi:DUF6328 family protein [Agromyces humi]|uniref:DUF6328 family protein n=1 Tax=Agromyces humi TaxID=1766800 RepID=UPI00193A8168|nr:DUF6328 family protein [Agromyces humi]
MNARHAGPPVSDALGRGDEVPSPDGTDPGRDGKPGREAGRTDGRSAGALSGPAATPPAHDEDVAPGDGRNETPNERSDRNWSDILQELRVALTGTQLIGGFLLAVAFQQRFEELDQYQLVLYLVLVALAGLATIVGLAPVTLHRTLFRHQVKERIVRTGNRLLIAHLAVVALLVLGVTTLIFDFAVSRAAGIITFVVGAIVLVLLWLVLPRLQEAKDGDDPEVVQSEAEDEAEDARKGVGTPS